MSTARYIDENGFMLVKGCPISSFGIFDYCAGQLGLDGDPNRIVKVFRPESAVNNPETINSFKNVPFIDDHEMLSGHENDDEGTAPEEYGIDGIMTSSVYYEQPWLLGDLKIFSRKMQKALRAGKSDLSLGYSCDFEVKPGTWNGQDYEVIQTNMRGNHIALVDEGRVPGARVLDGRKVFDHLNFHVGPSINEDNQMSKNARTKQRKTAADNAVEQLKALIPALEQFLNEEAAEPEHQDGEGMNEGGEMGGENAAVVEPTDAGEEGGEEAGAEPGAEGAAGGELAQLISQVEALCAQLKAKAGVADEGEGEGEEGEDGVEGLNPTVDEDEHGEDEGEAEDEGEGRTEEGNGHASKGPAAGEHAMAGDASLRRFYADSARKDRLVERLQPLVGTFAHKGMDARSVAVYGLKKLGLDKKLKVKKGGEFAALDAYLAGVDTARKATRALASKTNTAARASDSRISSSDMDSYLAGSK